MPRSTPAADVSPQEDDVQLAVARLKTEPKRLLDDAGLTTAIGADHFYPTVHAAVDACR